ncbi:hypothetical protein NDU88_001991 [Pleurodeles waltl]|uniref:Uncharacterized protein n=1 Tax=Pleurodeles waltl TaxID=8319 RepID=A0AAV7T0P9_PLEWA|nr:hypothetical protein NDU88_001991 [Pleurodeles waltl]
MHDFSTWYGIARGASPAGPTWRTDSNRALPQDPVYPVVSLCTGAAQGVKWRSAAAEAREIEEAIWDRRRSPGFADPLCRSLVRKRGGPPGM